MSTDTNIKLIPQVGMIIKPLPPHWFRSGAEAYDDAVIISIDPFKFTSRRGDMLWSQRTLDTVILTSEMATPEVLAKCMIRL